MGMKPTTLRLLALVLALPLLSLVLSAQTTAGEKTAEQVFKNIQVFKGKPANELRPTMSFIASSLGVQCGFCHDVQDFSADTKRPKATARQMIQMVFAVNQNNFDGRNTINCYTCHQGHNQPTSTLTIAADLPPGAAPAGGGPGGPGGRGPGGAPAPGGGQRGGAGAANRPTAQAVLDKSVAAMGGADALAAIHSETVTAQRTAFGQSTPETVVRADGKLLITDGADSKSGYDGSQFWSWSPSGLRDLGTDTIGVLQTDVELYPGAGLKADGARVFGEQPVGDKTAVVMAVRTAGGFARYYFDKDSGLLLRAITSTPTYLGSLPLQVDYSDYRAVEGGAKLPFDIQWSTHDRTWERKVDAVKLNGAVDAAAFSAPAAGGGQ